IRSFSLPPSRNALRSARVLLFSWISSADGTSTFFRLDIRGACCQRLAVKFLEQGNNVINLMRDTRSVPTERFRGDAGNVRQTCIGHMTFDRDRRAPQHDIGEMDHKLVARDPVDLAKTVVCS